MPSDATQPLIAAAPAERQYLFPGRLLVSRTPCDVTTILGSCVAVCLWEELKKIGGICHFLLPEARREKEKEPNRFGNLAIENLVAEMNKLGAITENLQAKIFGGASVLVVNATPSALGGRNIDAAQQFLQRVSIPIISQDVGGNVGRKLIFQTASGIVWVKTLKGETEGSNSNGR